MGLRSSSLHVEMNEVILRSIPKRANRNASEYHLNRVVRNFQSRRGSEKSRGRRPPSAEHSSRGRKFASDLSRGGFRPPLPLADNPASIIGTWREEDLRPTPKPPSGLLTAHSVKGKKIIQCVAL